MNIDHLQKMRGERTPAGGQQQFDTHIAPVLGYLYPLDQSQLDDAHAALFATGVIAHFQNVVDLLCCDPLFFTVEQERLLFWSGREESRPFLWAGIDHCLWAR